MIEPIQPAPPWMPIDPAQAGVVDIGEGLTMASDGTVLIPDGVGAIGPDGQLWVLGDQVRREDGVVAIMTPYGEEYLVLPNQMIITPTGTLVDVPAIRQELLDATATTLPGEG